MGALVESSVEDTRHLSITDVVATLVSVRGNQCAVGMYILIADKHGELVALTVDAQGAVAGVIKDHGVALLRNIHKILLHGGKNAVVRGLIGRKKNNSRAGMSR